MNYYFKVFKKYATFKGRATRTEYWYFEFINFIISLSIVFLSTVIAIPELSYLYF
jgi:uncharacterized membrane protein YhaH (DUF805 family)